MPGSVTKTLDSGALAAALVSGIHRVIGEQDFLNHINVFPVADGDTGTNLSLSLGSALAVLRDAGNQHLGTLLPAVADTLLDNSRGNSGAIVAQFFQGLSDSAGDLSRFTPTTFANAFATGSEYANDALSEPREGTILTVIAAVSDTLAAHVDEHRDGEFPALIDAALQTANAALAATTEQLDVLRNAGVVDAGAKGFVELLHGMNDFVVHGDIAAEPDLSVLRSDELMIAMAGSAADSEFRFCTECIVTGADIDRRKLRDEVSSLLNLMMGGNRPRVVSGELIES